MSAGYKVFPGAGHGASLRRFAERPHARVRLVCFSWCGAGASMYRKLAMALPEQIELFAVQLPGREERFSEPPWRRMEQCVAQLVEDVAAVHDRPLILFGHSMGALLAYEMALALQARSGRHAEGLIVSGCNAPQRAKPQRAKPDARKLHGISDDQLIAHLAQLGGTPRAILEDRQAMEVFLPIMRADYEVLETYQFIPGRLLSCPLIACAGNEDNAVADRAAIEAWRQLSESHTKTHWFIGDHFYLASQPHALARHLADWCAPDGFFFNRRHFRARGNA